MPSIPILFDTLAYSNDLQRTGMNRSQAELIATKMHNTLTDALKASQIATKQDIQLEIEKLRVNLMERIEKLQIESNNERVKIYKELRLEIEKVRAELKENIADTNKTCDELRLEIEKVRADIERVRADIIKANHLQLRWFIGIAIALAALFVRSYHLFGL